MDDGFLSLCVFRDFIVAASVRWEASQAPTNSVGSAQEKTPM